MNKVAVIGASGFVGATLIERLLKKGNWEIVPIIHTSGNAWRLARLGIKLTQVDILKKGQIADAIKGCSHIVNCSRGGNEVMLKGLENLLSECKKAGDVLLIHLGSTAVYGDPPPHGSEKEDASANPRKGTYGWVKLKQEALIKKYVKRGVPSTVLCPPNIIGPYSGYLLQIYDALSKGRFVFIDGGNTVCNTVDVSNLCHAIELSLEKGPRDGSRLFITDGEKVLWKDVVEELIKCNPQIPIPNDVNRVALEKTMPASAKKPVSFWATTKHLVSSDVREALRKDPLLAKADTILRNYVSKFGGSIEEKLRLAIEGPAAVPNVDQGSTLDLRLCAQQLRGVWHSCKQAEEILGYSPVYNFRESMAAFRACHQRLHGWDTPVGDLLKDSEW